MRELFYGAGKKINIFSNPVLNSYELMVNGKYGSFDSKFLDEFKNADFNLQADRVNFAQRLCVVQAPLVTAVIEGGNFLDDLIDAFAAARAKELGSCIRGSLV